MAIYEGRKNSKERKIRTENERSKKSDLYYFLANQALKKVNVVKRYYLV